jgi:hypothetical protein
VTFHTDHTLRLYEHAWIRAGMGAMAGQTLAIFKWAMKNGALGLVHQLLVTFGAEVRVHGLQQTVFIRTMTAMTRDTIASHHGRVCARLPKLVFELDVTGVTHRV